jgi:hypothetical protein
MIGMAPFEQVEAGFWHADVLDRQLSRTVRASAALRPPPAL